MSDSCDATNESEFLTKCANEAELLPSLSAASLTVRAYRTRDFLWLFDKKDGHLVYKYNRKTGKTLYECEHINQGGLP